MKKLLSILLSLLMICAVLPGGALAQTQTAESDFVIKNGVLVKYTGTAEKVIVPEGVTKIGDEAFRISSFGFSDVVEIYLPEGVTEIGDRAFFRCHKLTKINLPDGMTTIGDQAFYYCISLTKVDLPDTLTTLKNNAFFCCYELSEIKIPSSLTDIGTYAFSSTAWMNNRYDEGLVIINNILLNDARGLRRNRILYFPDNISSAVLAASNIKAMVVPPSITDLSKLTYDSSELTTVYGIPGSYAEQFANEQKLEFRAIALNRSTLSLTNGKSYNLKFNSGSDAVWKSSDSKVVSVDQNGKITAKKNGAATITATLYGKKYTCKVTVGAKTYTVKRGDTLWGIAAKQLGSGYRYKEIMKLNGLKSTKIVSGQRLKLPER